MNSNTHIHLDSVQKYFYDRGLSLETQREWGLRKGAGETRFSYYSELANRACIPIYDWNGELVAINGRVIRNEDITSTSPKYWNTPFDKTKHLFGIRRAYEEIRRLDYVVVVEDCISCIAAHQAGLRNVVGVLGTALTFYHLGLVAPWTNRVVLAFDDDKGGRESVDRILEQFKNYPFEFTTCFLEIDLDEFLLVSRPAVVADLFESQFDKEESVNQKLLNWRNRNA